MPIVLSQRIELESNYDDRPFSIYHYPTRYKSQISPGDIFVYYQGNRNRAAMRYYFGYGVIGSIEATDDGNHFYAQIVDGVSFPNKVPIYNPQGGYYESIDYTDVRHKPKPAWQSSIRPISQRAFDQILADAGVVPRSEITTMSHLEKAKNTVSLLISLNEKYKNETPRRRDQLVSAHLDRGQSITRALKDILGAVCQICDWVGFTKKNGDGYIEAHHLTQLALLQPSSLCSDNIILVCPNCHRELHHGNNVIVEDRGAEVYLKVGVHSSLIKRNSLKYLMGVAGDTLKPNSQ